MMRKIIPIILLLLGMGGGAAAGYFLRPSAPETPTAEEGATEPAKAPPAEHLDPERVPEYAKLSNQFVVPIVKEGQIGSVVAMSLSLEVAQGTTEQVFAREPRLRDEMLQLLFDYANAGGFDGAFTESENMVTLREGLLEIAVSILGDIVSDVLITEIVRQDG